MSQKEVRTLEIWFPHVQEAVRSGASIDEAIRIAFEKTREFLEEIASNPADREVSPDLVPDCLER